MKRKLELIMVLMLLIGVIAASQKLSQYVSSTNVKTGDLSRTIIIDPGHGGGDPGKVGINNALEKDLNLQISKKLKSILEEKGYTVIMTRTSDAGLNSSDDTNKKIADMKKRVALINNTNPPLVVSIHQNSYPQESIKGAQVFYYSHSKEGETAAKVLQTALKAVDPDNNRQAKANDTYYLLKKTKPATVIVECGFLSNSAEAKKLTTEDYQNEIAEAVCSGIIQYLDQPSKKTASY